MKKFILLYLFISIAAFFLSFCSSNQNELIIFHAGSITKPLEKIIDEFNKENPNVVIKREIAGSVESAKKISELNKYCDIFISADYFVIDEYLIPKYATWNIKFASNEIVIAYTKNSKMSDKINSSNFWNILLNENIRIGKSDPNLDPCGYRTVLSLKLADIFYFQKISKNILTKKNNITRPKEVDLLALLESNEVDYVFIYRSVAEQYNLKIIKLPDEINLSNPNFNDYYKNVSVELKGNNPFKKKIKYGDAIAYGLTIPTNSKNKKIAIHFLKFMLDKNKGIKILENCGQKAIIPAICNQYNSLPEELKSYVINN